MQAFLDTKHNLSATDANHSPFPLHYPSVFEVQLNQKAPLILYFLTTWWLPETRLCHMRYGEGESALPKLDQSTALGGKQRQEQASKESSSAALCQSFRAATVFRDHTNPLPTSAHINNWPYLALAPI